MASRVSTADMYRRIQRRSLVAVTLALALPGVGRAQSPCCGPISPAGLALARELDELEVGKHWLVGEHVDWRTGDPDPGAIAEHLDLGITHCGTFAAAASARLGVYLLRPPEHGQGLLVNAQAAWLSGPQGAAGGWGPVTMHEAQEQANRGNLVVAIVDGPYPNKPGHTAIVRPSEKSQEMLQEHGPDIIMAGRVNSAHSNVRAGFQSHPGVFPDGIHYYVHALSL